MRYREYKLRPSYRPGQRRSRLSEGYSNNSDILQSFYKKEKGRLFILAEFRKGKLEGYHTNFYDNFEEARRRVVELQAGANPGTHYIAFDFRLTGIADALHDFVY